MQVGLDFVWVYAFFPMSQPSVSFHHPFQAMQRETKPSNQSSAGQRLRKPSKSKPPEKRGTIEGIKAYD
jgi:hypothetical protein